MTWAAAPWVVQLVSPSYLKGADRVGAAPSGRLFFTSRGRTGLINTDGSGLQYLKFDVPNQATWQPSSFFADGRRVLLLSMEPRRDGPGKPFEEYYHQTPTHLWIHDLESGSLTEYASLVLVFRTLATKNSKNRSRAAAPAAAMTPERTGGSPAAIIGARW